MSLQENKILVQRFWEELWNRADFSAVHELVADDFVLITPQGKKNGPAGLEQWIATIRGAAPDIIFVVEEIIAEDDKVVTSWSGRGTNSGSFAGRPPTNNKIMLAGISIFHIENQRIIEEHLTENMWELMQQLNGKMVLQ